MCHFLEWTTDLRTGLRTTRRGVGAVHTARFGGGQLDTRPCAPQLRTLILGQLSHGVLGKCGDVRGLALSGNVAARISMTPVATQSGRVRMVPARLQEETTALS